MTSLTDPISSAMIQVAEILGAQLIAAAADPDAAELAQNLGASRVILGNSADSDATDDDLHDRIDVVVDSSSGSCQELIAAFAAPGGRLIVLQHNVEESSCSDLMAVASSKGMSILPVSSKLKTAYLRKARHQAYRDLLEVIAKDRCPAFSDRVQSEIATSGSLTTRGRRL